MSQHTTSVRDHCLSPARARVAIDAAIGPATYARMFPELSSYEADEEFLHALGRAGGLCDGGDQNDPRITTKPSCRDSYRNLTSLKLIGLPATNPIND